MWTWDAGEDECSQRMEHYVRCDVCLTCCLCFLHSHVLRFLTVWTLLDFIMKLSLVINQTFSKVRVPFTCFVSIRLCRDGQWRSNFWAVRFSTAALSRMNLWTHRFFPQDTGSVSPHRRVSHSSAPKVSSDSYTVFRLLFIHFTLHVVLALLWLLGVLFMLCVSVWSVCVCMCVCLSSWVEPLSPSMPCAVSESLLRAVWFGGESDRRQRLAAWTRMNLPSTNWFQNRCHIWCFKTNSSDV